MLQTHLSSKMTIMINDGTT